MNIAKALRFEGRESTAFVGAGGKTSAMFALARELGSTVVITTSTHLGLWQAGLADTHFVLQTDEDIERVDLSVSEHVLVTGPVGKDDRLSGLSGQTLTKLHRICRERGIPLLIEADGARYRNLKAPAAHEPQVPQWVDRVVVMAGLGSLGERLNSDSVFRPEIFSALSGLSMGEKIRVRDVVEVLGSPQGGLKGLPEEAAPCLFLNQAEGAQLMAQGHRIAKNLVGLYDRILIGSLEPHLKDGPVFSVHTQTAGVILAAGGSQRLGQLKQLLNWEGQPFIVSVVCKALEAGLAPLYVVTGHERETMENVLAELPVKLVYNPDWSEGQSTSMRAGLQALPAGCQAVVFLLSDQPQVSPVLIRQFIERFAESQARIIAPMTGDGRANPVLFGREAFGALLKVEGDRGGRAVFNQFKVDWLPWVDSRICLDVDQLGDEQRLQERYFGDLRGKQPD